MVDDGSSPAPKRRIDVERRAQIGLEKRARTRRALLDGAFDLLGRKQGLTTTIEEICASSKIARGTFYNYFNSTDELFDALSYDISHDFNLRVTEIVAEMPEAAERAAAAIRYYLGRAVQDPKWAWAMVNISAAGPIFGAETFRQAQVTVEEGIASGEFELTGPISGRDMLLGTTLAAMATTLAGPPSPTYPISVARHVLLGMGVSKSRVEEIIQRTLPDPAVAVSEN